MQELRFAGLAAEHHTGRGDAFAGPSGRPCVVMAHGFAGTRDSGLRPYAEAFAEGGLDVLLFDFRGFGASDGERQDVSVRRQHADFRAAIAHARGLDGVDPDRIVLWGTSYSGGHVIAVGAQDGRVAAVVAQTPAVDGLAVLDANRRAAGAAQLARLTAHGLRDLAGGLAGRPHHIPVVGPPGSLAAMTTPDAEPGYMAIAGPDMQNRVRARTALEVGLNRPIRRARGLGCPLLVQVGDRDVVTPPGPARKAARRAPRGEVREYPIGHFEIYLPPWRERAIEDVLGFLRRHLARPAAVPAGAAG
jgi:uncharacterized protein